MHIVCAMVQLLLDHWKWLEVGTVPTFKRLEVGTVPTFKRLEVGTVPTFKRLEVGTLTLFLEVKDALHFIIHH